MSEKLVRNRMPDICATEPGHTPMNFRIARGQPERQQFLEQKLEEELSELHKALGSGDKHAIGEEIADLMEVLRAVAFNNNITPETVEAIRQTKARIRGTFSQGIIWDGKK